ncbi:MAG: hypothetical protein E7566_04570 [Ruminococcaceae bacterium]|nr:hypothetical protein [Oscillospiraceae bacterium]
MNLKRILSVIIVALMALPIVPMNAFATDAQVGDTELTDTETTASVDEALIEHLLGDTDLNDTVNVRDATMIQKCIAGISTLQDLQLVFADGDRNGDVNVRDATAVQKFVAGLLPEMSSVGRPFVANPETYRYYFYMPESWYNDYTAKTGNTAGIYWWDGTNSCDSWPGIPAKKGDVEGVYYYDVPKDVSVVIWNNYVDGGSDIYEEKYYYSQQTINIGSEYYDPDESENYPEGTENFDNMIYIVDYNAYAGWSGSCGGHHRFGGEWYYYYGNGEYGTAKIKGESEVLTYRAMNVEEVCPSCGNSYINPTVPERPPVEPEPEKPHPGTNRYYFYMPEDWLNESTATTGNTAGIYWWEGTDACDYWPGVPANKGDVEGIYYYDVPKDVTAIIWNNFFDGGADPSASYYDDAHHTIEIGTEFYYADESDFYPEGTENFDNMIYVIDPDLYPWGDFEHVNRSVGEWFYYYGGGEYGTAKVKGESKLLAGDTVDLESLREDNAAGSVQTRRYYFYRPQEWNKAEIDTVGIYWWDGTGAQDEWPGLKAKKGDVEGVYYYDVPVDVTTIIWNNYFDGGFDPEAPHYRDHLQTRNIATEWYDPGESDFYPDGTRNFDGMIYVTDPDIVPWWSDYNGRYTYVGEWFYYYGDGEYGTTKVKGESEVLTGDSIVLEDFLARN